MTLRILSIYIFFISCLGFHIDLYAQDLQDSAKANTVSEIKISGNRNIEAENIKASLVTSVGSPFDPIKIREDIDKLFQSGFFENIEVFRSRQGKQWKLTYRVTEKPPITEIIFNGNSGVKENELREAAGLRTFTILNRAKIQEALDKMAKLYEDKGYFLAKISYDLTYNSDDESTYALNFNIEENDKVRVKKIRIVGNKNISDQVLKSRMPSREGGFFSFISNSGNFREENLERDVQVILHSYYSEGYIQARVDPPQTFVSPDKKDIFITFYVHEGLQYRVGEISFSGDLLFPEEELRAEIQIDKREVFSLMVMQNDMSQLQAKYGDLGYAFTNVIPQTSLRENEQIVDVNFVFDKGEKVYFGQINVTGNDKTRDKVIRRELRIFEGELYHETRKRRSHANVRRLGFFEDVAFKTSTPEDRPNVVDIEIQVREKNTGSIQVGAGYSSYQKFVFNGQINQANLFGYGQKLGFMLNYSQREKTFSLSFTEPYIFDTNWSFGIELYNQDEIRFDFEQVKRGAAIRLGHPITDYLSGFVRYRLDDTKLKLDPEEGDPDLFPVETVEGVTSSVTISLEYDKRDDRLTPRDGMFASASYEYAGLGGDKDFYKTGLNFRYYKKVFWELVWRNNISFRTIESLNDRDPPFNELFLLGGPYSLRGFRNFSVGRKKFSVARGEPRPFGGKKQFVYNLEMEFPLIEEAGIRGVVFYDIGNAEDRIKLSELRSNYGFGFRWMTPFGPLRFEWGFPINRKEELGEAPYNFDFSIGSPF